MQRVEAAFDPLPFDLEAARAYGRAFAAVRSGGRPPRRRVADLMIAAVAVSHDLPLVTRNAVDFVDLGDLLQLLELSPVAGWSQGNSNP